MRPPRRVPSAVHIPVLRASVLHSLALSAGLTVVDATVGAGGHSQDILEQITHSGTLIGIDRDPMMLQLAAERLRLSPEFTPEQCHLRQGNYVSLPDILEQQSIQRVDRVLADLGLSSDQLSDDNRGFGFESEGPLDLRFDTSAGEPAAEILRTRSADELAAIFRNYGEERHAAAIAKRIAATRQHSPIHTAQDLAACVESVIPHRGRTGIHPATRVFQALRIAANRELEHVTQLVGDILPDVLRPGGRAVVVTFHSLEDRIVKHAFRNREVWEPVTKKPLQATPAEKRHNPRSRSAKLRAVVRK